LIRYRHVIIKSRLITKMNEENKYIYSVRYKNIYTTTIKVAGMYKSIEEAHHRLRDIIGDNRTLLPGSHVLYNGFLTGWVAKCPIGDYKPETELINMPKVDLREYYQAQ
jgi:hypothetical protein